MKAVMGNRLTRPLAKTIWITGASSGLGRALALELARQGQRIFASARNNQALETLAATETNITAITCDITDEASLQSAIKQIDAQCTHLDQVILNAGNCEYLDFPEPDWSTVRRVMEVNYFGSVNCLRVAIPLLRANTIVRPHIVVIASQATAAPFPRAEAYGASKAALQYFFASLRMDLYSEGIDVTVVNPGFVDTPLTRKNDFSMPFLMNADQAARRIAARIEKRPRSYSFPGRLFVILLLARLMPGLWQNMFGKKKAV